MLQGFVKLAVKKAYHEKFLGVVQAIYKAELLVTENHFFRVILALIINDLFLVVEVYAWADLFHVLCTQLHGIAYQFDLRPVHVKIYLIQPEFSLLLD